MVLLGTGFARNPFLNTYIQHERLRIYCRSLRFSVTLYTAYATMCQSLVYTAPLKHKDKTTTLTFLIKDTDYGYRHSKMVQRTKRIRIYYS